MIRTVETEIDIGGLKVLMNIVANADDLYMDAIHEEETPVWLDIWPAAIGLSRWLWHRDEIKGRRIMELGAGLGLAGIVAAIKGGNVLQTDYIDEAMRIARQSAQLNGITNIEQVTADWRDFTITEKFDYIIGSDFLYLPGMHDYLKNIFLNNLKPGGKLIISDPGRVDSKNIIREMLTEGWQIEEDVLIVTKDKHQYYIHIFQLSR